MSNTFSLRPGWGCETFLEERLVFYIGGTISSNPDSDEKSKAGEILLTKKYVPAKGKGGVEAAAHIRRDEVVIEVKGAAEGREARRLARMVLRDFLPEYAAVATQAFKAGRKPRLVISVEDEGLREAFRDELERTRRAGERRLRKKLERFGGDVKAYVEAELARESNAWKRALIYGAVTGALALALRFALPAAAAPLAEGYKKIEETLGSTPLGEVAKYTDPLRDSASEISRSVSSIQEHLGNGLSSFTQEVGKVGSAITDSLEKIPGAKEALDSVYQHAQSLKESVEGLENNVKDMVSFVSGKLSEIQEEASKLLGIKGTLESTANSLESKGNEMISYGNRWTRTEVQDYCAAYRADPTLPGGKYACELLDAGNKAKSWGIYLKSTAQSIRGVAGQIETIANNITGAAGAASDYMATKSAEIYSAIDGIKGDASAVMDKAGEAKSRIGEVEKALNEGKESAGKLGRYVEEVRSDLNAIGTEAGKIGEEAEKIKSYAEKIDLGVAKVGDKVEAARALARAGGRAAASYVAWVTIASYGGMLALPALAAWYAYRTAVAVEAARRAGMAIGAGEAVALGGAEVV